MPFYETSAKDNKNVEIIFKEMVKNIVDKNQLLSKLKELKEEDGATSGDESMAEEEEEEKEEEKAEEEKEDIKEEEKEENKIEIVNKAESFKEPKIEITQFRRQQSDPIYEKNYGYCYII